MGVFVSAPSLHREYKSRSTTLLYTPGGQTGDRVHLGLLIYNLGIWYTSGKQITRDMVR